MKIIFTNHSLSRSDFRKIHKTYIIEAVKFPDKITREGNRYIAYKRLNHRGIEVVYEREENFIKVVTVYWS